MLNELYTKKILDITAHISHVGRLDAPQASAHAVARLCGSEIQVDLSLDETGAVKAFAQEISACALGQACAAIVANHIEGTQPTEIRQVAGVMRAMLKTGGLPPTGRWADLALLEGVRAYPARHGSTLLVFEAIEKCLDQLGV